MVASGARGWFYFSLAALFAVFASALFVLANRLSDPPIEPRFSNYLEAGDEFLHRGRYRSAYIYYRKALALKGNDSRAADAVRKVDAFLNIVDGKKGRRVEMFKNAVSQYETDPDVTLMLAKLLSGDGRYVESARFVRKTIDLDREYPEAWFMLGRIANEQGNLEEAAQHYALAVELAPKEERYKRELALSHLELGNPDEAKGVLEGLLENTRNMEDYVEFTMALFIKNKPAASLILQDVLISDLARYLDLESDRAAWCLLSGEEKVCLRHRGVKTTFLHMYYLISLYLAEDAGAGEEFESVVERTCGTYRRLGGMKRVARSIAAIYVNKGVVTKHQAGQATDRMDAVCTQ